MIDEKLLSILVCPKCKGKLEYREDEAFICPSCGLKYEIRDGIPNFLIDEAEPIDVSGDGRD